MKTEKENDLLQMAWDSGWKAYWDRVPQTDRPNLATQEAQDEWMMGWLSAQSADLAGL